jgi:large subunit ribosomal protein L11
LKRAVGLAKGSAVPHRDKVGTVTREQLLEIVRLKMADINANDEEAGIKIIAGTARSMGIDVVD